MYVHVRFTFIRVGQQTFRQIPSFGYSSPRVQIVSERYYSAASALQVGQELNTDNEEDLLRVMNGELAATNCRNCRTCSASSSAPF